jgi:DNA gyrase subunit A
MKSQPLSEYRAQKRGGRGKQAAATKDEDWIDTDRGTGGFGSTGGT